MVTGGVQRHQHHGRRVGVAGVEVGGRLGVVGVVLVVPAAVTVLGGDEELDGGGGHLGTGSHQSLDGEGLGERLAVAVLPRGRVVGRAQRGEQILPAEGLGGVSCRDHRLDQLAAPSRVARGAGLGGARRQVVHHRLPRARSERLGIVSAGGGADRVQLAVRVAPRGSGDCPARPLLGPQVEEGSGRGGRARPRRHPDGRACRDQTQCRHHGGAPAGSLHPTLLRRRSVSTSPKASSPP